MIVAVLIVTSPNQSTAYILHGNPAPQTTIYNIRRAISTALDDKIPVFCMAGFQASRGQLACITESSFAQQSAVNASSHCQTPFTSSNIQGHPCTTVSRECWNHGLQEPAAAAEDALFWAAGRCLHRVARQTLQWHKADTRTCKSGQLEPGNANQLQTQRQSMHNHSKDTTLERKSAPVRKSVSKRFRAIVL